MPILNNAVIDIPSRLARSANAAVDVIGCIKNKSTPPKKNATNIEVYNAPLKFRDQIMVVIYLRSQSVGNTLTTV